MVLDRDVERALIVVAHPDDVDFWAGGTVACWTSAGIAVTYCVLTDGDSGGFDPRIPRSAIPDIRRDGTKQRLAEQPDDLRHVDPMTGLSPQLIGIASATGSEAST